MRHYMEDPDNEERLLKIPPGVVAAIRDQALLDAVAAVKALEPLLDADKYSGGYDCCGCGTLYDLYEDAITAIEDLGTANVHTK